MGGLLVEYFRREGYVEYIRGGFSRGNKLWSDSDKCMLLVATLSGASSVGSGGGGGGGK